MGKEAIEHAEQWYGERGDVDAAHIRKEAQWYPDGPQWYRDEDGDWHFPGPDVSAEGEEKLPMPINIVPMEQGFVVNGDLAFTDAIDLADWLLDWLGFEEDDERCEELVCSDEYKRALDVVMAAQVFVDLGDSRDILKLAEAVKKWRGIEGG